MTAETEFQRRLESLLSKEYELRRDQLARGVCRYNSNTAEDYAHRTGFLLGLEEAGKYCKEIAKDMNGGDTPDITDF